MRRFAENTVVSVGRSRGQIDDLLRSWGCAKIQWGDDFEKGTVELHFTWKRDPLEYVARFSLRLPDDKALREQARHGGAGKFLESKYARLKAGAAKQQHRVLLLWLKAALNAVEAGIIDPAVLFLPFLVGKNGQTFAEVALPRLKDLLIGSADRLLPEQTS